MALSCISLDEHRAMLSVNGCIRTWRRGKLEMFPICMQQYLTLPTGITELTNVAHGKMLDCFHLQQLAEATVLSHATVNWCSYVCRWKDQVWYLQKASLALTKYGQAMACSSSMPPSALIGENPKSRPLCIDLVFNRSTDLQTEFVVASCIPLFDDPS